MGLEQDSENQPRIASPPPNPAQLYKHPLEHAWTLWFLDADPSKTWEEKQHIVSTFNTVEDFWGIFTYIKEPTQLSFGTDYSLFKDGIRPMWEDRANKRGGKWVIPVCRKLSDNAINRIWLETAMMMVGNDVFEPHLKEICGAVVNVRSKAEKISLWTADGHNETACRDIGRTLKEILHLDMDIYYYLHDDTMAKRGTNARVTYSA